MWLRSFGLVDSSLAEALTSGVAFAVTTGGRPEVLYQTASYAEQAVWVLISCLSRSSEFGAPRSLGER